MNVKHFLSIQKKSRFFLFLFCEGIFCVLAAIFAELNSSTFTSIVDFPLQPLALMMQKLSLSGEPGNSFAWVLYILLSLFPAGVFVFLIIKKKYALPDLLLLFLTPVLFYCYELLINPGIIQAEFSIPDGILPFACGSIVDLIILLWIILRWCRAVKHAENFDTTKAMSILVRLLRILLVFDICYSNAASLFTSLQSLFGYSNYSNNSIRDLIFVFGKGFGVTSYYPTIVIIALGKVISIIPDILALLILSGLEELFFQMNASSFSEETVRQSEILSRRCLNYLIVGIALEAFFNLIQLLFLSHLLAANFTISLPIIPLIIFAATWIFTEYIRRGKILQDENDSFI